MVHHNKHVQQDEIHDEIHEVLNKEARFDYTKPIFRNGKKFCSFSASVPVLYEEALLGEKGTAVVSSGALATEVSFY